MKKIVIGVTSNVVYKNEVPYFEGSKLIRVFSDYSDSIIRAGGLPIIIPVTTKKSVLDNYIDLIDGLIVTGGYDVNPLRYDEEPHELLGEISEERDEFEFYLVEKAIEKQKPLLGICRGHQLINVACGGSLYQDISLTNKETLTHNQKKSCNKSTHTVDVEEDTHLYNILGNKCVVNSFHHLAVKDLAKGFIVSAYSKDGIIEAIEHTGDNFIMGLQWHPECLTQDSSEMLDIFNYFVNKCK